MVQATALFSLADGLPGLRSHSRGQGSSTHRNVWKQRGKVATEAEDARVDARQAVYDEIAFF